MNSQDSSTMTEQDVTSRSFKSYQTTCHAFPEFFTPELVISLNTSSIYMKAWFRSSFLRQNLQESSCLSRAICEADNEVVTSMKSPIAHVLSEVLRLVHKNVPKRLTLTILFSNLKFHASLCLWHDIL